MDAPKCRICRKKHYGLCSQVLAEAEPALEPVDLVADRVAVRTESKSVQAGPGREGCSECGATAETFEDAARWVKIREQQRLRMRRKRNAK